MTTKIGGKHVEDLLALQERGLLSHAYIFFGPPQTGSLEAAKELAARLEAGTAKPDKDSQRPLMDSRVFAPDEKGAVGIDTARAVRAFLSEKPFASPRRTAIIDRADTLTSHAQNALLKVAEEPPASALLILALPDPELLWPTLCSRFQKIYFPPAPGGDIAEWFTARYGDRAEEARELAVRFFKTPPAQRKDYVKELTEPEDFNFAAFLDSLIAHLAAGRPKNSQLWHAVLELRRMQDATNLSPRIQLMNLWTLI